MKHLLLVASLALVSACGSAAKPDPRLAQIRVQHQQILAVQQQAAAQASNPVLVAARQNQNYDAQQVLAELVRQSNSNLASLDQLDPNKGQEAEQIALVADLATKEDMLLRRAQSSTKTNQRLIDRAHTLDSLNQQAKQILDKPLFNK